MNSTEIMLKLHQYIETAQEKKLKAIYTIIEDEIEKPIDPWDDPEFVDLVARREQSFLNGKAKTYSWEEVQKRAKLSLQKTRLKK